MQSFILGDKVTEKDRIIYISSIDSYVMHISDECTYICVYLLRRMVFLRIKNMTKNIG